MEISEACQGIREGGCIPPEEYKKEEVGGYTLLCKIGKEEKSVVYLAVDQRGREVAIKAFLTREQLICIPEEYRDYFFDERGVSKLAQREWELGKELKHPHIAEIYDFFTEVKEGQVYSYIVMEYVEENPRKTLSETGGIRAALGLVDALIFSFEKGYIHRDLYSENIIVSRDGMLKLIDIDSFSSFEEDLYPPEEVDKDGDPMDPLDGYLKGIETEVSRFFKRDLSGLIPPDTNRNIRKEDLPLILNYLHSLKERLATQGN